MRLNDIPGIEMQKQSIEKLTYTDQSPWETVAPILRSFFLFRVVERK